jgi:hypothetical protein
VLGRTKEALVSIAVEGKVNEPFGPTVAEWVAEPSEGKQTRLAFLAEQLGVQIPPDSPLRYQLLHRTVSAILEAERFRAAHAMVVVHSFSSTHAWFDDFEAFLRLWGLEAKPNQLHSTRLASGRGLHFAWVQGEEEYLRR